MQGFHSWYKYTSDGVDVASQCGRAVGVLSERVYIGQGERPGPRCRESRRRMDRGLGKMDGGAMRTFLGGLEF